MNTMKLARWMILLSAMLLIACGSHERTVQIAPEFQTEVKAFELEGVSVGTKVVIEDLIVRFGKPSEYGCPANSSGCCRTDDNATPIVVIDKTDWLAMDLSDAKLGPEYIGSTKQILIDHELGHCLLGRGHRNDLHHGGVPASVMEAKMSGYLPQLFHDYNSDYVKELFGVGDGPNPF